MTALYIIFGIIALIVILFSIKVSVTAEYADSFSLDVQWLFIKLHIFPQTEEQKAKREAKKAKKEEKKRRTNPPNPRKTSSKSSMRTRASAQRSNSFRPRRLSSAALWAAYTEPLS